MGFYSESPLIYLEFIFMQGDRYGFISFQFSKHNLLKISISSSVYFYQILAICNNMWFDCVFYRVS